MRLCEHPDSRDIIQAVADRIDRTPQFVEKDYYVTEALRISVTTLNEHIIFKGGTSLSKGWNLLSRFSEDLDLYVDPQSFGDHLGSSAIDRKLKGLRDQIDAHPGVEVSTRGRRILEAWSLPRRHLRL